MNIFSAIVLGLVEGITEFLPISSTFHLLITEQLLGLEQTEFSKLFSVFIQSGAILSVLLLFFKDLWEDKTLVLKAALAFIPTAIAGLLLYDIIKSVFFESTSLLMMVFVVVGVIFIIVERFIQSGSLQLTKVTENISYTDALIIGTAQACAIVPGVSRAGSIIIAMLLLKYKRTDAARFSFIVSIPTIFAAAFLDLYEMRAVAFATSQNLWLLAVGFLTAFLSSLIIVKWFIAYLQKHSLTSFGIYRIVAGIALLLLL